MSLASLQSWLLKDGIHDDLQKIVRLTVAIEVDNLVLDDDTPAASSLDWPRLLLAGSILARSDDRTEQEAALRIATGAVTLAESPAVKDAGAVLLGKLSNFRAVALASERDMLADDLNGRLGVALRIEAQRREIDRSVLVESSGTWLQVNDFQQRFWINAGEQGWLSASAPTASGKTYLVLQWLIDQMTGGETRVAVYLAPTRALVSEIETNLQGLLGASKAIEVSSLPLREKYDAALSGVT